MKKITSSPNAHGMLTVDKSCGGLHEFLTSIKIVDGSNGEMDRLSLGSKIATVLDLKRNQDGEAEARNPYNKTKLARYFGFLDVEMSGSKKHYLTPRAKKILPYIEFGIDSKDSLWKFLIKKKGQSVFDKLMIDCLRYDTLGYGNKGAERSNSPVNPARVIMKTLLTLGSATEKELSFAIWTLQDCPSETFESIIETIKLNREQSYAYTSKDYREHANFSTDIKMIDLLKNATIITEDLESNRLMLREDFSLSYSSCIQNMDVYDSPLQLIVVSESADKVAKDWVNESILGNCSVNSSRVIRCSGKDTKEKCEDLFYQAYEAAEEKDWNVFFVVEDFDQTVLNQKFKDIKKLFDRINDHKKMNYGESKNTILPKELGKTGKRAIQLKKNFNFIGIAPSGIMPSNAIRNFRIVNVE